MEFTEKLLATAVVAIITAGLYTHIADDLGTQTQHLGTEIDRAGSDPGGWGPP